MYVQTFMTFMLFTCNYIPSADNGTDVIALNLICMYSYRKFSCIQYKTIILAYNKQIIIARKIKVHELSESRAYVATGP